MERDLLSHRRGVSTAVSLLFALSALLGVLALFSDQLEPVVGYYMSGGVLTHMCTGIDEPVSAVELELPTDLFEAINPSSLTAEGWSVTTEDSTVTLSWGSLDPGAILEVHFKLRHCVSPRETTFTVVSTAGDLTIRSEGVILVQETTLLQILHAISLFKLPLLGLSVVGIGVGALLLYRGEGGVEGPLGADESSPWNPSQNQSPNRSLNPRSHSP